MKQCVHNNLCKDKPGSEGGRSPLLHHHTLLTHLPPRAGPQGPPLHPFYLSSALRTPRGGQQRAEQPHTHPIPHPIPHPTHTPQPRGPLGQAPRRQRPGAAPPAGGRACRRGQPPAPPPRPFKSPPPEPSRRPEHGRRSSDQDRTGRRTEAARPQAPWELCSRSCCVRCPLIAFGNKSASLGVESPVGSTLRKSADGLQ